MHFQGLEPWARWLRVSCSTNWARSAYHGDPWENRTPVCGVRGRRLDRLTNGPWWLERSIIISAGAAFVKTFFKTSAAPLRDNNQRESRRLPIFPGRLQPSIFGTTELNFCVRNGNRWDLCVIGTGHICSAYQPYIFSLLRGMHPQNWIINCLQIRSTIKTCGQALDLLVHASSTRHRAYTLCLSTL